MKKILTYLIALLSGLFLNASWTIQAQEINLGNGIVIDKNVHNFGDILMSDGAVSCVFTVTNGSKKPIVIYNVVTSCGCTEAKWTRNPIRPGEKGKITVTYTNDEGAYSFSKSVTAYVSEVKRPVVLRIKGNTHEKQYSLEELYPLSFGPLALEKNSIRCGNMSQGQMRSNSEMVANLSDRPIRISFENVSDHLEVKVQPNPIPARSTARLHFCITSSPELWGNNEYHATVKVNDKVRSGSNGDRDLIFTAFTIEDFSNATRKDLAEAPLPEVEMSSYDFGVIKKGQPIRASFILSNQGGRPLIFHKVDSDIDGMSHNEVPDLKPGQEFLLKLEFDTCCVPQGDYLALVTLTTNSPSRPYVNLFVTGSVVY